MDVWKSPVAILLPVCLFITIEITGAEKPKAEKTVVTGPAVLWTDPVDLERRDLFYGSGGEAHAPRGPFTFVKEDLEGSNPKFVVKDGNGIKWKVKMGREAQPETAASRIVWSVGYYTSENYFLQELKAQGMPERLHRGWKLVDPDGTVHNVRLKREPEDGVKIGNWYWRHDAFTNTRELNGLRALLAVINDWDLKDENNAIYQIDGRRIYVISDLGATFGTPGITWPLDKSRGNLEKFSQSRLFRDVSPATVDFQTPGRPKWVFLVSPMDYRRRLHLEWIGQNVPRSDAKWMGMLLARLSPRQLRDAFRAAGYSPREINEFADALESRILQLTDL